MHRVVALWTCLLLLCSCDTAPEPTAETVSAFTCGHVNPFTHLCTEYLPDLIPGAPTNNVPLGDPEWCPPIDTDQLQPGWSEIYNTVPITPDGHFCAFVPPGYYGNLGDWNYDSPFPNLIPSVHVRNITTGPQSYLFAWDGPNFGGNFIGFYGPGSTVNFTSTVRSFEVLLGQ